MYPIYAACVELGIPIFVCAGVPGPRVPFGPQDVARIDIVMFDFPDLVFVTRHGCEPWEDLAVKLMLKWPNLYYSTSAFAPRYYPKRSSTTPTRAARTKCSMPGISRWDYRWSESSPKCPTSPSATRCGQSFCTATPHAFSASIIR
ncbi:amidohydrolase family protein [Mycobacterium xenopi 3993]|nr:amidohydrolase family protein [Mycobacterium xenopi 3993]